MVVCSLPSSAAIHCPKALRTPIRLDFASQPELKSSSRLAIGSHLAAKPFNYLRFR
jgi:hypothetical protein